MATAARPDADPCQAPGASAQPELPVAQVELKTGEAYRGELHEAEDNWNCQIKNATATAKVETGAAAFYLAAILRPVFAPPPTPHVLNAMLMRQDGRVSHLEHIFIRGSRIRWVAATFAAVSCLLKARASLPLTDGLFAGRFLVIPDMLKNAPMFKRIDPKHKVRNPYLGGGKACHGAYSHAIKLAVHGGNHSPCGAVPM